MEIYSGPYTNVGFGTFLSGQTSDGDFNGIEVDTFNEELVTNDLSLTTVTNFYVKDKCLRGKYAEHFEIPCSLITSNKCDNNWCSKKKKSCCQSCED